jgi:hypothetical protein
MSEPIKPAAPITSATAATTPKQRFGDIQPGSFHGRPVPVSTQEDEDEALIRTVTSMSGDEMAKWMRIKGNSDKLVAAYAKRKQR